MRRLYPFLYLLVALLMAACHPSVDNPRQADQLPPMYPDYTDVTIPYNIAPLNFLLRADVGAVLVEANGERIASGSDASVCFSQSAWQRLLQANKGKSIEVKVYAEKDGEWTAYKPFHWQVAQEPIDPYLTYRLIEPDYEVWNRLRIMQRCVENFQEKALADHNLLDNRCMNCHITSRQDPSRSMLYVRGEGGGAILNEGGKLRKLNLNAKQLISGSVYYDISSSGRYVVFSSNLIFPAYHAQPGKRMEVYDTKSDVYVADLQRNEIIASPLLADSTRLETFPVFSPDEKYIYFCSADRQALYRPTLDSLQYDLLRVGFDVRAATIGTQLDTIYSQRNAPFADKHSVCHPRVSPDGKYLLFTVAHYGTFPIWHQEADLQLLHLGTGQIDTLQVVNSGKSDTYHSWSSNSRWFVFASKRDDGLYGKPYFAYIDRQGRAHKPFVLPQQSPAHYDETLKSYNIPELCRGELPFDTFDVQQAMRQQAEEFRLRPSAQR